MSYEAVDRLPAMVLEPYESDAIQRWRREGLPAAQSPIEFFGLDQLRAVPLNLGPLPAFERRVLSETADVIVETDWLGTTVRRRKASPGMYYGHVDHPIKCPDDWRAYRERFRLDSPGRLPQAVEATVAQLNGSPQPVGLVVFPFFFRLGFYSMGMERFLSAFYDAPGLIHEMFSHWSALVLGTVEPFLRHGLRVDCVVFAEDLAYKTTTHISPATYRQFWLPHQDPVVKRIRDHGVECVCVWTSGNVEPLLPLMMEHGINCTWPLERNAIPDPVALRRKHGRTLRLGGGVPKEALIAGPDAIDAAFAALKPLTDDGGFLPAVDDMVPPEVPFSHYRHYVTRALALGPGGRGDHAW
jgi:uroporphyrinogen decarboxylase